MPLSVEYVELVREAVKVADSELEGKLPPHPRLKKRNPYAHLYERIKSKMGRSYKDCEDWEIHRIINLIDYYRKNPC
jgi:hypothetical protein